MSPVSGQVNPTAPVPAQPYPAVWEAVLEPDRFRAAVHMGQLWDHKGTSATCQQHAALRPFLPGSR